MKKEELEEISSSLHVFVCPNMEKEEKKEEKKER